MFEPKKIIHIVGSSSVLLENKMGELIDQADYVVRFNRSIVQGFEEYVGSKTTHRYVNRPAAKNEFEPYQKRNQNFFKELNHEKIILDDPNWNSSPIMNETNFYKVFSKSCDWTYLNRGLEVKTFYTTYKSTFLDHNIIFPDTNPSVGFAMVCYCLNRKFDIKLFGFGIEEDSSKSSHYYEDKPSNTAVGHNYMFERKILKLLYTTT